MTALLVSIALLNFHDEEPTYQVTQTQLEALGRFQNGRAEPTYTWNAIDVWMKHVKFPSAAQLKKRVPLVGIDGHAFWTRDETLRAATAFPDITYANFAYCCIISDDGIAHLKKWPSLKVLILYRTAPRFGGNLSLIHISEPTRPY